MNTKPKFSLGQKVFFPWLIIAHDGRVSACEVLEYTVKKVLKRQKVYPQCEPLEQAYRLHRAGAANFVEHSESKLFRTRQEAADALREKITKRIGHLTEALHRVPQPEPKLDVVTTDPFPIINESQRTFCAADAAEITRYIVRRRHSATTNGVVHFVRITDKTLKVVFRSGILWEIDLELIFPVWYAPQTTRDTRNQPDWKGDSHE